MNETDSDDSDDEQSEIPEQVIDPDNPWLAERKEFTDFIAGYTQFVQNSNNTADKNDEIENSKLHKENNKSNNIDEQNNEKIIDPIKNIKNKKKTKKNRNKVKNITIEDLANLSNEESDVEVLKIVTLPEKKVHFANDTVEPKSETKINCVDKNNYSKLDDKKINNIEVIQTTSGPWFVSSEKQCINNENSKSSNEQNINNINSKKKRKKLHKDVENIFETVETELKNIINVKLEKLNKVEVKQQSKEPVKHKDQEVNSNYLKMNNKRTKTELNEPLYEDNKTLDKINSSNIEDNQGLSITNVEKPIKQVQNIDPTEFLQVTQTNLETEEMDMVEDRLDDKEDNEQDKLIAEAFADDDIINEFKY